jgi:hypothetical protein
MPIARSAPPPASRPIPIQSRCGNAAPTPSLHAPATSAYLGVEKSSVGDPAENASTGALSIPSASNRYANASARGRRCAFGSSGACPRAFLDGGGAASWPWACLVPSRSSRV